MRHANLALLSLKGINPFKGGCCNPLKGGGPLALKGGDMLCIEDCTPPARGHPRGVPLGLVLGPPQGGICSA
jgi:hypothetical protein